MTQNNWYPSSGIQWLPVTMGQSAVQMIISTKYTTTIKASDRDKTHEHAHYIYTQFWL